MKNLPESSDMLEELANKAIGQMNRLAVTSFKTALREMIDFHRFLIDAYTTTDEDGNVISFAQIGDWGTLHNDWIRQYRRIFERAVSYIGRENDFIEILAHVPRRLLPTDGRRAAPEVTIELLNLASIEVRILESWLTSHRTYEAAPSEGAPAIARLAGSDKQAYKEIVMGFVGAWESTLQFVNHIYTWRQKEVEPQEQWHRYTASWPLLQRHMRNSTYHLAVAVWNEDEIGANYYCDSLLLWFDGLKNDFETDYYLNKTLLTPNLLDKDWTAVQALLEKMVPDNSLLGKPKPDGVFGLILRSTLADAIVVSAGVMLAWFIERRQNTDIAVRIVTRFLNDDIKADNGHHVEREVGFRPLMLNIIRIYAIGGRAIRQGYGQWLDSLVERLDGMTERRVVTGRIFTPSIRHDREDLLMPWLACLLALVPEKGDEKAVQSINQLTKLDNAFIRDDQLLRGLLFDMEQARKTLVSEENQDYLERGTLTLKPDVQIEKRIKHLASIFDDAISGIKKQRRERLQHLPVDEVKLNAVRERVEQAITQDNGGITIFKEFIITREVADFTKQEFTIQKINKGFLTEPAMADDPSSLWEITVNHVQDFSAQCVWFDLMQHSQRIIEVQDESSYLAALTEEANKLIQVGQQPVLLVQSRNDPSWIHEWFAWNADHHEGRQVRRKNDIQIGSYVGTVNDIDVYRNVYRPNLKPNQSLLFRDDLLKTVRYSEDDKGHVVDLAFIDEQNEGLGTLAFQFSQKIEWREDEIIALQYPTVILDDKDD